MPQHVSIYAKPSPLKREGEDAIARNARQAVYAVMDGVTPLDSFIDGDGHNGAYTASNLFREALEEESGVAAVAALEQRLERANRRLREAMRQHGREAAPKHELWSTCGAAVQLTADGIRYAQLGDCMIVVRQTDGISRVVTSNRVSGISERAAAKRERDRLAGIAVEPESYYEVPLHRMQYNRRLANTPEGYGVANGEPEAMRHLQTGLLERSRLSHLLLVSDGMFHPELPLETTLELVLNEGWDRYVERVEAAERERGMRPDDRSAVLLTL